MCILKQASEGLKDASIPAEEGEAVLLTQLWHLKCCILADTEESWQPLVITCICMQTLIPCLATSGIKLALIIRLLD